MGSGLLERNDVKTPIPVVLGESGLPELQPRFRLSTLLLSITSSAVCLAVARANPTLAMVLVLVLAIALIRLLYAIQLHALAGKNIGFTHEIGLLLVSICCVLALGGFVVLAFSVTLGAGIGLGILCAWGADGARETEWIFGGFVSGWILGFLVATVTFGYLVKPIWCAGLRPVAGRAH